MTHRSPDLLVIGLGNDYRHDDGLGLSLARRLRDHAPAGVSVVEQSGEGAALLEAWKNYPCVFLLDAVHSGARPGTIHRLELHPGQLPSQSFQYSTHAFSVAEAIALARVLGQLPPRLVLYGIEVKNSTPGPGLSGEIEQALPTLLAQLLAELHSACPSR